MLETCEGAILADASLCLVKQQTRLFHARIHPSIHHPLHIIHTHNLSLTILRPQHYLQHGLRLPGDGCR